MEGVGGAGRRHHPPAAAALPRRADRGGRPGEPPRVLGADPRPRRTRHDGLDDHALHGRGGALPPALVHLPRLGAGHRDAGGDRRAAPPACRRAASRGRGPRRRAAARPARGGRGRALRPQHAARGAGRDRSGGAGAPGAGAGPDRFAPGAGDGGGRVRVDGAARLAGCMTARAQLDATLSRLWSIALKELLQLRRDRLTLAMMVALPVFQLMLFGYAIDTDVRHIPTVVYDQDKSAQSRDFAQGLQATGFYDLLGEVRSYEEIARALRSGRARVALVVPVGYASELARGPPATLQLVVAGSDPQTVASPTNTPPPP